MDAHHLFCTEPASGLQPGPSRKKLAVEKKGRRPTARENAQERKSDRTAAFYEHVAPYAAPSEIRWRHKHWQAKRVKVQEALQTTGSSPTLVHNFANCGAMATAQWSEALGKRRLSAFYCHSRHCEPCARAKANKIAANLRDRLAAAPRGSFRFTTYTLKHSDAPLADQISRLYKCFKKLRNTKVWKSTQTGGAVILEVKHNGKHWHPHLHVISQGKFIRHQDLKAEWLKATGDSYIIDIKLIDRANDAAAYVCKYITKSTQDSVWNTPDRAQEWIIASKGVRTANTFGSWRKFPLTKAHAKATDWKTEETLVNLFKRAAEYDRVAFDILNALRPAEMEDEHDRFSEFFPAECDTHGHPDDDPPI